MKYEREHIEKLPKLKINGKEYLSYDSVMRILNYRCGDCKHFSKDDRKKGWSKCTKPVHSHVNGWRYTTPTSSVCRNFQDREYEGE